jgi:hypothetical protein
MGEKVQQEAFFSTIARVAYYRRLAGLNHSKILRQFARCFCKVA